MQADSMCVYTRKEWVTGMTAMGTSNAAELKDKIPELRAEIADPRQFKKFYEYNFMYAKESGQKSMGADTARAMWELLFVSI